MCEGLVSSVFVGDLVAGSPSLSGNLSKLVRPLVAGDSVVRGDPADGGLIVSAQGSGTGLHGCDSEALTRAGVVRPDSVNGGRGVHKNGVPVAALLSLV